MMIIWVLIFHKTFSKLNPIKIYPDESSIMVDVEYTGNLMMLGLPSKTCREYPQDHVTWKIYITCYHYSIYNLLKPLQK